MTRKPRTIAVVNLRDPREAAEQLRSALGRHAAEYLREIIAWLGQDPT